MVLSHQPPRTSFPNLHSGLHESVPLSLLDVAVPVETLALNVCIPHVRKVELCCLQLEPTWQRADAATRRICPSKICRNTDRLIDRQTCGEDKGMAHQGILEDRRIPNQLCCLGEWWQHSCIHSHRFSLGWREVDCISKPLLQCQWKKWPGK